MNVEETLQRLIDHPELKIGDVVHESSGKVKYAQSYKRGDRVRHKPGDSKYGNAKLLGYGTGTVTTTSPRTDQVYVNWDGRGSNAVFYWEIEPLDESIDELFGGPSWKPGQPVPHGYHVVFGKLAKKGGAEHAESDNAIRASTAAYHKSASAKSSQDHAAASKAHRMSAYMHRQAAARLKTIHPKVAGQHVKTASQHDKIASKHDKQI